MSRSLKASTEHPAKDAMVFNVLVTAVQIGDSIGLFHLARRLGVNDVASYLIASISPVLGGFIAWAKVTGASAAIFADRARGWSSTRASVAAEADVTTHSEEF